MKVTTVALFVGVIVCSLISEGTARRRHSACHHAQAVGRCRSSIRKYFFNHQTEECEIFLWGGCGGNANKFDSYEECMEFCKLVSPELLDKPTHHGRHRDPPQPELYDKPQPELYERPEPELYDKPQPELLELDDKPQPELYDKPQPELYEPGKDGSPPQPELYDRPGHHGSHPGHHGHRVQPELYDRPGRHGSAGTPELYDGSQPQPELYDKPVKQHRGGSQPQPELYDKPQPELYDKPQPELYDKPQPELYEIPKEHHRGGHHHKDGKQEISHYNVENHSSQLIANGAILVCLGVVASVISRMF